MEPARTDRADRQAEAKALVARANSRPAPREKLADAAAAEPARVKARVKVAAAVADRAREEWAVDAVRTVNKNTVQPKQQPSSTLFAGNFCGRTSRQGGHHYARI
jgi:hypothetical protein